MGGNCNTLLIANIWGEESHIEETISTLRFATRMMCVSTSPHLNIQYDPLALLKKYEREIKELKQELSMHDTLSNKSHVQYEPFSESQRADLQKVVRSFVDGELDDIEVINLRQIREIFSAFRIIVKQAESEADERTQKFLQQTSSSAQIQNAGATSSASPEVSKEDKDDGVGDVEGGGFSVGLVRFN